MTRTSFATLFSVFSLMAAATGAQDLVSTASRVRMTALRPAVAAAARELSLGAVGSRPTVGVGAPELKLPEPKLPQPKTAAPAPRLPVIDQIISQMQQSEGSMIANIRNFRPMVEIYIQNLASDATLGVVPTTDAYALGRFDWKNGPRLQAINDAKESARFTGAAKNRDLSYVPDGFVAMAVPDWRTLDKSRYEFTLVRREFVGEARCFVLDVKPRSTDADGFSGRIWVEDRGFNIVRFNGINTRIDGASMRKRVTFNVDSWRTNSLPGLWLPSYAYVEEMEPITAAAGVQKPQFKGQIRLWGYNPQDSEGLDELTAIHIDESSVRDEARQDDQLPPALGQRRWEQEAEANVLERLERTSLLAPTGDVERVLETVINNLLITSDINLDRAVKARVLLTSPLDSFTIGHTIVLSRGLIDVLPDEASLAMVLAHELSHIVLGHAVVNTQFAFASRLMATNGNLEMLRIRRDAKEETAADANVIEMLKKSPYADKLASAGLFLKFVAANQGRLTTLIPAQFGSGQIARLAEIAKQAPALAPERLDQMPAMPLGARLVVDPWSRRVELVRSAAVAVSSIREKGPLAVTPLMPRLKYAQMQMDAALTPTGEGAIAAR